MTHKLYFALSVVCLVAVIATQCSNSPARTASTSTAIPVASTPEPYVQQAPAPAMPDPTPASAAADLESHEPAATPRLAATRPQPAAIEGESLSVRRLIVAHGVEDHEPVGSSSRFNTDDERVFAFMEMANPSDEAKQVIVTFESNDGTAVGHVRVNVPANAPRWRTWAWSRQINRPGTWTAVLSTPDGTELGRERFEVEG